MTLTHDPRRGEGIVIKHPLSSYVPGERDPAAWIKLKPDYADEIGEANSLCSRTSRCNADPLLFVRRRSRLLFSVSNDSASANPISANFSSAGGFRGTNRSFEGFASFLMGLRLSETIEEDIGSK